MATKIVVTIGCEAGSDYCGKCDLNVEVDGSATCGAFSTLLGYSQATRNFFRLEACLEAEKKECG